MDNLRAGLQTYCDTCRQPQIAVNGVYKCFHCENKKPAKAVLVNTAKDPGESKLAMASQGAVKDAGVFVKGKAEASNLTVKKPSSTVDDALSIMKSLPMPEDIKQFKQIKKIIGLMEKFVNPQE